MLSTPASCAELLERAQQLRGLTIEQLAIKLAVQVPNDFKHNKGWVGQLIELALGATAGANPEPDFPHLGIELKTIPVDMHGKPFESTYVSVVPLINPPLISWHDSLVCQKLTHVLWLPLITDKKQPATERQIGPAILWQPSAEQQEILQQDWEELMDMVCLGELEQITAHIGRYLQIRPKGANAQALSWGLDAEGERIATLPRGFYLRPSFTAQILKNYF